MKAVSIFPAANKYFKIEQIQGKFHGKSIYCITLLSGPGGPKIGNVDEAEMGSEQTGFIDRKYAGQNE